MSHLDHPCHTRDRLVAAGIDLFDRDGYENTSLDALCHRVSVTKGALYRHFPSKQALAVAVVEEHFRRWHDVRAEVEATGVGPLRTLVELTCRMCSLTDRLPAVRVGVRLLLTSELFDLLAGVHFVSLLVVVRDLLGQAVAAGEVVATADVREEAEGIAGAVIGAQALAAVTTGLDDAGERMRAEWAHRLARLSTSGHLGEARTSTG
ncbi:TetR family transcriptional regulator [Saccharothrix sp. Mg75]|uniref:TetR family transcriptional regulator n=1 Tax=Saccharothrix sp. Mg75 TaxID=3445357 RepID=UPI003EEFE110